MVIGPCSIHNPTPPDYASRLAKFVRLAADLEIVMRVYFEAALNVGWKG